MKILSLKLMNEAVVLHKNLVHKMFINKSFLTIVYIQIFEGCNFRGFRGQLAFCKIFILEVSLANFGCHVSQLVILKNIIAKMLDL